MSLQPECHASVHDELYHTSLVPYNQHDTSQTSLSSSSSLIFKYQFKHTLQIMLNILISYWLTSFWLKWHVPPTCASNMML